ncbi:NDR1/HIN1-like protein 13 [Sesamum alatum]|uniref:NDR1/HIN1-like protein 13 n=1 Tax=Sesamum alatum TaxID=300844 RepID=A0AAE1YPU1_9LAMI|nr:NDR1/HIN1-like protein 13 [Sesamum alatum]
MEEPEEPQSDEKDRPTADETHHPPAHETNTQPLETTNAATSSAENDEPLPQSSSPTFHPGPATYVVQIPKDQIYRVPPPENAHMLEERTRNPPKKKRSSCCLCSCFSSLVMINRPFLSFSHNCIEKSTSISALQLKNNDQTMIDQPAFIVVNL